MRVAVIGTGLIGTSVALALREHGVGVWLADRDPEAARLAANLGAGRAAAGRARAWTRADVAVIAVPPAAVAATLAAAQAARGPGRLLHRRGQREAAAGVAGPGARLRHDQLRARPPAGRPGEARPRGRPRRPVPRPDLGAVPGARDLRAGRRRGHRAGQDCAARCRCGPMRPPTTAGSRWSRTPRTWSPRPWRPGWRPPPAEALGPGRAGTARRDQDRRRRHRPVDPDPGRERRTGRRGAGRGGRRPGRGGPDADRAATPKSVATLLDSRPGRGGQDPRQARRRAARVHRGPGRHPRPARRADPAVRRGRRRPASTSRTSGSSTRPGCRSAWPSSRSAPPRPARCWPRWRRAAGRSAL